MDNLRNSIRNNLNKVDGWIVGRTYVVGNRVGLTLDDGKELLLKSDDEIEILNGEKYEKISYQQLLETKTSKGWHLFAGFDARVKMR